uniref:Amino acid transporter transmembrane domain-containing protein n=1 Tax=Acrobeloides nanus TaxID=290746 RepID=A0A914EMU9_9BILA
MLAVVFVAESIPTFGPVLDLVGGSSQTFTAIVFPVLFYVFIWAKAKVKEEYRAINKTEWDGIPTIKQVFKHCPPWLLISCGIIIVIGVIGAATATYSAILEITTTQFQEPSILEITTTQFQEPCYVSAFKKGKSANDDKHTNCCGHNQTINRYNDISRCSDPDLGYYT